MVKKILFAIILMILALQVVSAENDTLTDSYSYDYLANGTSVNILRQTDTDLMTTITLELNTTPGELEVSAVLGIISTEQKFFGKDTNVITLEFNKVLPGQQNFLLMIYREDSLIAFITNEALTVLNNVKLTATGSAPIIVGNDIYIQLDFNTNLAIENSTMKLITSEGTIYPNTKVTIDGSKATYIFTPYENSEYSLYELNVNGYVKELTSSIGTFDFSLIKDFTEEKTTEGLKISFSNKCAECELEIIVMNELNEFVYSTTTKGTTVTIPSANISASEVNGPYVVKITAKDTTYKFLTSTYTYGDFATETPVVEKTTIPSAPAEEIYEETNSSNPVGVEEVVETNVTTETTSENVTEEITITEETIEEPTVKENKTSLLTGLSIGKLTDNLTSKQKTLSMGITIFILLSVVIGYVYIRQRKDAYLYEM